MIYRELMLPPALRAVAFCAWEFLMEPQDPQMIQHAIPPDGAVNLVLIRAPDGFLLCRLVGPSLAAATVPVMQGFGCAGLRIRPEFARAVAGDSLLPNMRAEAALDGSFAPVWRDLAGLLDGGKDWEAAGAWAAALTPADPAIALAVDWITVSSGTLAVTRLAAAVGLSERQFRRRFHLAAGISPKQYADVQRVRRAIILSLTDPDWAGIACDAGFADQPHLARDIRERFGVPPRQIGGYLGGIRHELIVPDVRKVQDRPAAAA